MIRQYNDELNAAITALKKVVQIRDYSIRHDHGHLDLLKIAHAALEIRTLHHGNSVITCLDQLAQFVPEVSMVFHNHAWHHGVCDC